LNFKYEAIFVFYNFLYHLVFCAEAAGGGRGGRDRRAKDSAYDGSCSSAQAKRRKFSAAPPLPFRIVHNFQFLLAIDLQLSARFTSFGTVSGGKRRERTLASVLRQLFHD
jgi:hypothetical protein